MAGVSFQVSPWLEEFIVKFQIEVMGLEIGENPDAGDGARKFSESVPDILRHKGHAVLKFLIVNQRARPHLGAVLPRTRSIGMEGPIRSELTDAQGLQGGPHIGVMGRAKAFEYSGQTRKVRKGPTLVGVITET